MSINYELTILFTNIKLYKPRAERIPRYSVHGMHAWAEGRPTGMNFNMQVTSLAPFRLLIYPGLPALHIQSVSRVLS